jgi:hypothetical protein
MVWWVDDGVQDGRWQNRKKEKRLVCKKLDGTESAKIGTYRARMEVTMDHDDRRLVPLLHRREDFHGGADLEVLGRGPRIGVGHHSDEDLLTAVRYRVRAGLSALLALHDVGLRLRVDGLAQVRRKEEALKVTYRYEDRGN